MMTSDTVEGLTTVVNIVASILSLGLIGAILFSMLRRVIAYRKAEQGVPTLLKSGISLFLALSIIAVQTIVIRLLSITLPPDSLERLVYITETDVIVIGALVYYAKAELFDVDDPDKK